MDKQESAVLSDSWVDHAVGVLRLLADPTRLKLVWALLHGEHSVNALADHVGAAPAAVSQHLAKLRLAGLVVTRREGTRIYYSAATDHVLTLVTEAIQQAQHLAGETPGHHLKSRSRRSGGARAAG